MFIRLATVLPEKDRQRKGDSLNDDPRHEAVKVGLHEAGPDLLNLEGEDEPLGEIEDEEKDGDLASGLFNNLVWRQHL